MKCVVRVLVPVLVFSWVLVCGTGCGNGSGKSEINTQPIPAVKPGEAKDMRDIMNPKKK